METWSFNMIIQANEQGFPKGRLRQIWFSLLVHQANCSGSLLVRMTIYLPTSSHVVVAVAILSEWNLSGLLALCAIILSSAFVWSISFCRPPPGGELSNPAQRSVRNQQKSWKLADHSACKSSSRSLCKMLVILQRTRVNLPRGKSDFYVNIGFWFL